MRNIDTGSLNITQKDKVYILGSMFLRNVDTCLPGHTAQSKTCLKLHGNKLKPPLSLWCRGDVKLKLHEFHSRNYLIEIILTQEIASPVQTSSEAHPASHTVGTGSFLGVKRPGRGVDHPSQSSAEVKERVELYLYSPSGPSRPIIG
jgi:hypothetical protein